jgi:mxaK protein
MGMSSNRQRTRWALAAGAVLIAAALLEAALLWRDLGRNRLIAQGAPPDASSVPELRFARAHAQAASGAGDAAQNGYRALHDHAALGTAARFNGANLLLRQAIERHGDEQPGQALPLIELAKEQYREVLRRQPLHWDARYNLERAQRLLPDPEDEDLAPAAKSERERAATTMRSQSLGLP